jgi:transcriptional regulator GlxA family with amidase domain
VHRLRRDLGPAREIRRRTAGRVTGLATPYLGSRLGYRALLLAGLLLMGSTSLIWLSAPSSAALVAALVETMAELTPAVRLTGLAAGLLAAAVIPVHIDELHVVTEAARRGIALTGIGVLVVGDGGRQTEAVTMSVTGEVIFAVSDGVLLLDVAGPVQVFDSAGGYRVRLASPDGRSVRTDVGVSLSVDLALSDLDGSVDTLVVPGYPRDEFAAVSPGFVEAVGRIASRARRVVSVCTGAFLLAEAGLLHGRRVTTHWDACAALAARFPDVRVEPDAIYVRDGSIVTSAGVTAGIDLALALVGEDLGEERARSVAKYLVVFLQRPGGQAQFGIGDADRPRNATLRQALDLVRANLAGDHRLTSMAARLAVSERHLTRLFRRELGLTPGRFVERLRVEAAQASLEAGDDAVHAVAKTCGFGSTESMRRAFLRVLGVPPSSYRHRFRLSNQRTLP